MTRLLNILLGIAIFLFAFIPTQVSSQCNVNTTRESTLTVYANKAELIYINKDLENGVIQYHINAFKVRDDSSKIYYMLESYYTYSANMSDAVPRKLVFTFVDGTIMEAQSHLESGSSKVTLGEFQRRRFYYRCPKELYTYLAANSLSSIKVIDNRSNKEVVAYPYKDLIKEQFSCLTGF